MSDLHCAICGEPWDAYGVTHGDMFPWQADLFKRGAGCPCCEGQGPEDSAKIERAGADLLINGPEADDTDGIVSAILDESYGIRIPWIRPPDPVLGACSQCDIEIKRDIESGDTYWGRDPRRLYHSSRPDTPDPADDLEPINGIGAVCADCRTSCDQCGATLLNETDDCYSPGASWYVQDLNETYCTACYERIPSCSHCGQYGNGVDDPGDLCSCGDCREHCRCRRRLTRAVRAVVQEIPINAIDENRAVSIVVRRLRRLGEAVDPDPQRIRREAIAAGVSPSRWIRWTLALRAVTGPRIGGIRYRDIQARRRNPAY